MNKPIGARAFLTLARHRTAAAGMVKAHTARPKVAVNVAKQPKPPKPPKQPNPGDYVRVQRPGMHDAPTLARALSSGRHGVTVADSNGRRVKVRHEHVLEHQSAPTGKERAEFASSLHAAGVPVSLADRFMLLDHTGTPARRAGLDQLALLEHLTTQFGVPIDMARVQSDATFDDAQALLSQFVDDPEGRIVPSMREAGSRDDPDEYGDD
jgi:hypothetical protein